MNNSKKLKTVFALVLGFIIISGATSAAYAADESGHNSKIFNSKGKWKSEGMSQSGCDENLMESELKNKCLSEGFSQCITLVKVSDTTSSTYDGYAMAEGRGVLGEMDEKGVCLVTIKGSN